MANCSDQKNPLHNNGTSQSQRLLAGLDRNAFALPDEKEYADWIVFANNFATFINYYNTANKADGNWQPFFSSDISAQLGTIAVQNIESYRQQIKEHFDFIRDDDNESNLISIKIKLNDLFSALLTLSKAMDYYVLKLSDQTTLKQTMLNLVKNKLAPALNSLIAYFKAAQSHAYINQGSLGSWVILNIPLTNAQEIIDATVEEKGLSNNWYDDTLFVDWNTYINSIDNDDSIYNNPLTAFADDFLSIEHAANHNLFTGIFDTYLSTYTKIIQEAETELLKTLESYDAHTPHYALFLSFLMLFRFTQTHINTITQRHLDFYYKEVLCLLPKPAEANQVHVLGELAKQVDSYLLVQGTALKAGKDSLKKDVSYTFDNDAVFNKAKVVQLKTFYKAATGDTVYETGTATVKQNNTGRVFASPIANSDDGINAALTSDNKEWQPYVHKIFEDAELESIAMPKASLGFALASHYLYLTEGKRKVFVRFALITNAMITNAVLNDKSIECYLTAEKEWYKVDDTMTITSSVLSDATTACAEISFTIPGSAPAIVNYNAAIHGGTFNVALPMLKIYLINDDSSIYEYDALKDIAITKTEIKVAVGMDDGYNQKGLKNLLLSNDFGVLDASKPFMPFGTSPTAGSRLVIGNKEIFSKKNTTLKLNLEWKDLPADRNDVRFVGSGVYPNIIINNLEEGIWKTLDSYEEIFEDEGSSGVKPTRQLSLTENSFENSLVNFEDEYSLYDISSNKGFVALQLTQSFGHKEYLVTLTDYLVRKSNRITTDDITLPVEPYIPMLQSIYAGYSAYCINDLSATADFDDREINFFHIYPFGDGEQHAYLNPTENVYLLPQFKHTDEGVIESHIGELYIGIENLAAQQSVNILFQIMDGTTNPTVAKPAEHIHWSYLSNNIWVEFEASDYSDNTLDLVQSGIISFAIPANATTTNTVLPANHIWIRASVTEAAEAICELITVDAQATVATFSNNDNATDFLDAALAAGTIAKLKIPDAAVKKMIQPYSSFGGRAKEDEDHFYIRVSERLRHKARAIAVWDYEHLVLEAFPEIYKVKCLNHTQIEDGIYHEVKPGYVSIITIPSQQNRNDSDPLKPYTQQSTLTNIENYLRKRISCFVNLRACQPQFEEVRLEFSLKLLDEYKDFTFYANQLKDEITQYLSPWAYGGYSTIDFGGKVYKSVLINFIEERYYIDFITDVFMYVKVDDVTNESADLDEITASTARSILVSASASKHTIHQLDEAENEAEELCIDKNNIAE